MYLKGANKQAMYLEQGIRKQVIFRDGPNRLYYVSVSVCSNIVKRYLSKKTPGTFRQGSNNQMFL